MGFDKKKPLRSLIYGLMHPLELAERRPVLFLALVGAGVFFGGVWQGWWSMDSVQGGFGKK